MAKELILDVRGVPGDAHIGSCEAVGPKEEDVGTQMGSLQMPI
jgi:hypothetical protein